MLIYLVEFVFALCFFFLSLDPTNASIASAMNSQSSSKIVSIF